MAVSETKWTPATVMVVCKECGEMSKAVAYRGVSPVLKTVMRLTFTGVCSHSAWEVTAE